MRNLIILDVDGVLTDGKKYYDQSGKAVMKTFCDLDFTAIKKFKSRGDYVIWISGDSFNEAVARNRDIDFYYSRGEEKADYLDMFSEKYNDFNT